MILFTAQHGSQCDGEEHSVKALISDGATFSKPHRTHLPTELPPAAASSRRAVFAHRALKDNKRERKSTKHQFSTQLSTQFSIYFPSLHSRTKGLYITSLLVLTIDAALGRIHLSCVRRAHIHLSRVRRAHSLLRSPHTHPSLALAAHTHPPISTLCPPHIYL